MGVCTHGFTVVTGAITIVTRGVAVIAIEQVAESRHGRWSGGFFPPTDFFNFFMKKEGSSFFFFMVVFVFYCFIILNRLLHILQVILVHSDREHMIVIIIVEAKINSRSICALKHLMRRKLVGNHQLYTNPVIAELFFLKE